MVEGGMKCVKLLLFAFNFIFVVVGCVLIGVGAYIQIQFKDYLDFVEGQFSSAAALLIAVGVIIFFIAAFGCCGAWKENYVCVMIFSVLLGIVFILEIAGGIAGYVLHDKVEDGVKTLMEDSMKRYNADPTIWDLVQKDFKCCGTTNGTDWVSANNGTYPKSCCKKDAATCDGKGTGIYTEGCLDAFVNWVKDKIFIVGGVGIGLAFVQIVGILFACCFGRALKKEYEVV
ncbi:CD63 antigen-like [Pecten maximus]|uniref:CD63 antigen-like n=1 Tax=Pecten maximus TaxID=6579 RepID=UPI001458A512|nr:CD63 antigen-like [Pecten maximus]